MTETASTRTRRPRTPAYVLSCAALLLLGHPQRQQEAVVVSAFLTPAPQSKGLSNHHHRPHHYHHRHALSPAARSPSLPFIALYGTQQQYQEPQNEIRDDDYEENDKVRQLLLDAERLRLEAETMDANLTLEKITVLEEKLSNTAWLEKQQGQTVKDLYEELRRLEGKVARQNNDDDGDGLGSAFKAATYTNYNGESDDDAIQPRVLPPKPATSFSEPESYSPPSSTSKPRNPNVPPMAGFDDSDLSLYVPVAQDVNNMAPNATLNERIGLFRDAPELQAHFKQKIQNLILGPLEEMQELETLKQDYFGSSSSKEREALLKRIKVLEAKIEENNIVAQGPNGGVSGVGYSDNILIPADRLPPLTDDELEERYQTIRALPDILVAIYLQRNGLYDLPVSIATLKLELGNNGINVTANTETPNNKTATTTTNEATTDNIVVAADEEPIDLYEKLKLGIQLDYFDLQLQLLDQARVIPLTEGMRREFVAAYQNLPAEVREHWVVDRLGVNTLEASCFASDELEDAEKVLKEILQPMDESFSAFTKAAGSFLTGGGSAEAEESSVVPPEYNDVEFVDRSRYLEEFFPAIALLEDGRPSPEDVDRFVTDCLSGSTGGNKIFMVTSKPERVIGGYYIRGTNQFKFDEENSVTANDRLVQEVSRRLEEHPTLKDKIEFYYILNPSPPTDEEIELEVNLDPLFVVTTKDPKTMYHPAAGITKTTVSLLGLVSTFFFSLGSCVLNPKINAGIEKALDSASSATSGTTVFFDIDWFFNLCLPLYFSFLGILAAHELGHRIAASAYKVRDDEQQI